MSVNVQDVLKINVVFVGVNLLNDAAELRLFSQAVGVDVAMEEPVIPFPIAAGVPMLGRKIALRRDRITVNSTADRTIVEREFPEESDLKRLTDVTTQAIQCTNDQVAGMRAYGYNLELVYNQDSGDPATPYIGQRLFNAGNFIPQGWDLQGGGARLLFNSPVGRWTIQIEPRFNDENDSRVFLNLNLHKQDGVRPDHEAMLHSFQDVWVQAHSFAQSLDGSLP